MNIREAKLEEFQPLGQIMVSAYSQLEGFPQPDEQPAYYEMLANVGELTKKPHTHLLVAVTEDDQLLGGVVYFSDMRSYGSRSSATQMKHVSGFRLLAVDASAAGKGVGKALTQACIDRAKADGNEAVLIHTTASMKVAWGLYERLGFERFPDIDFLQEGLPVFGFRLQL